MDKMPRYLPQRDRTIRLDRHHADALLRFVRNLAFDGDDKAAAFLDALLAGAFDEPPSAGDSGLRLFERPKLENPQP
jgi:hypothetical protein